MSDCKCNGDGTCLRQSDKDPHKYVHVFDCEHSCTPIKCPNYLLCGQEMPQALADCHGGRCMNCDILNYCEGFKNIVTRTDISECSVCKVSTPASIQIQNSANWCCVGCFRQWYWPHGKPFKR